MEILRKSGFTFESLNNREVTKEEFDVAPDHMKTPLPLIYQSGFLTIKSKDKASKLYTLDFPNDEVRTSMANSLLPITRIGVNFDSDNGEITEWKIEADYETAVDSKD